MLLILTVLLKENGNLQFIGSFAGGVGTTVLTENVPNAIQFFYGAMQEKSRHYWISTRQQMLHIR
jgi:hypothetical protein